MVILIVIGAVLALGIMRWRRHSTLAGRNAEKPTYMVERPSRSVGNRKTEVL